MNDKYVVYVQTDEIGNITAINSSAFIDENLGIAIDEGNGDKFYHAQGNYFDKSIMTMQGIYQYKLIDGIVVEKTNAEISAEASAVPPPPPSAEEQLRADVDFLAIMTGVEL